MMWDIRDNIDDFKPNMSKDDFDKIVRSVHEGRRYTNYLSIMCKMIVNRELLNEFCTGFGRKESIINYSWRMNSKSDMDTIDKFESNY
jgi:hypothetical protein